jgi:hypothetical protein
MDLVCFVAPEWRPRIRPATLRRGWMDETPEAYAYRCLPLNIANAHGWEVLSPCAFTAVWDGAADTGALRIDLSEAGRAPFVPVSLFGHGVLTFHIEGLFRTPPGWNLWVSGPPNAPKDGISPLAASVETDWSPYTFTMNWKFTRAGQPVRFEENEPICFFFPVERSRIEAVEPRVAAMAEDPELQARFEAWSASRLAFHRELEANPPSRPSERWQKLYYRGVCPDGSAGGRDHQAKLRVKPFLGTDGKPLDVPEATAPAATPASSSQITDASGAPLRPLEWILEAQERQRSLSRMASAIHLRISLSAEEFLEQYYAPARPVLLREEMKEWPELGWTLDHLARVLGAAPVEVEAPRSLTEDPRAGSSMSRLPFRDFARASRAGLATARASEANAGLFGRLDTDLSLPAKFLDPAKASTADALSVAQAGAFLPLHLRLRNLLLAQIAGRERLVLLPPSETQRLGAAAGIFSDIPDIENLAQGDPHQARAASARRYEMVLAPGDMLFIPIGWWLQARALEPGISAAYSQFRWSDGSGEAGTA